ncbi:metal-sensitive transcriptional regulator [Fodinibacter luteus]|uniref:Metal-sensitive transcriptional regulator n=1 Tax=Fodinibacter luteus TaxID=552064 RepID=A0ABP8KM56_9MICO
MTDQPAHPATIPGYIDDKDSHLTRLRRIEGQVRGLQRMVENDTSCIDILTQVSAATKALEAVALGLLDDHLRHCLVHAVKDPVDLEEKLNEASSAIARLVRS